MVTVEKGVRIRRGSQLSLFNSVLAGYGVGLLVNDAATAVGQNSDSSEIQK
jgi:fatty acid-binding protein DegV